MEINVKGNGLMINYRVNLFLLNQMENNMKVTLDKIYNNNKKKKNKKLNKD